MLEAGQIALAIGGIKAAADAARGLLEIRDAAKLHSEVFKLNGIILAAQGDALAAQGHQFTLIERIKALEKEIASLERWDAEAEKYELINTGEGVFARALKGVAQGGEPAHLLCDNCFQHKQKSILQKTTKLEAAKRVWRCHNCKSDFAFNHVLEEAA